jgi:hypothetical protein
VTEITFPGSEVFATDLNPLLNGSNLLADLNGGSGISTGQFSITDRAGNSATITITSGMTIDGAINAIHDQDFVDKTQQLSDLEDSDLVQEISDMAALEFAL